MNRLVNKFLYFFFITFVAAFVLSGCGGGSAGTGTTTFTGKILTTDNQPVEGAVVRIVGSKDIATTDAQGQFVLSTAAQSTPHEIQVQAEGVDASVTVPPATTAESKIGVQLELDPSTSTVSIKSVEVKVSVIGNCARFFTQEQDTIVQSRRIPDETKCTVQVAANSGVTPVGGILSQLQRNTCTGAIDESTSWIAVASGRTRETGSRGRVDIKFTFYDDEAHCRYRIVAPSGDSSRTPLVFPIVTFREQGK